MNSRSNSGLDINACPGQVATSVGQVATSEVSSLKWFTPNSPNLG